MKNPPEKRILESILSKYRADPKGFRSYLPEAAQLLAAMYPQGRSSKSPFGLTERERVHHQSPLKDVPERLEEGSVTPQQAVRCLEHCATLIQDDSLPEEFGYETHRSLLKAAIGKSPGTFKKNETVRVSDTSGKEVINHVSLLRGVVLDLDRDMRLVSISITPKKVRERRKLLGFVGKGRDTAADVARRHDDYLVEVGPHAAP